MSIYMGAGLLLLILAILGRRLWCNGHYHGLTEGLLRGYDHGDRDGYARGYSQAALDRVLAQPTLDDHFGEALLSGALHEPVGEEMASLLGRIQEHERAARTEVAR